MKSLKMQAAKKRPGKPVVVRGKNVKSYYDDMFNCAIVYAH